MILKRIKFKSPQNYIIINYILVFYNYLNKHGFIYILYTCSTLCESAISLGTLV